MVTTDKPAIIGYWHADYDIPNNLWIWEKVVTYQVEVVDLPPFMDPPTPPVPFTALANNVTHVRNMIENLSKVAGVSKYTLKQRKLPTDVSPPLTPKDTGFDIRHFSP